MYRTIKHTNLRWPGGVVILAAIALAACTFDVSGVPYNTAQVCGDNFAEGTEYCDGNDLGGQTCASLQLGGGILYCNPDCTFNVSGCTQTAVCGDGVRAGLETCDDGNLLDGDGCDHLCRLEGTGSCGDGQLDPGEACDDGNGSNDDSCLANCTLARCGDGHLWAGQEVCEPGLLNTTCVGLGFAGGQLQCRPDCTNYDLTDCQRNDGQQCTDNYQCLGGECFQEANDGWPMGACSRDCFSSGTCPGDAICIQTSTSSAWCYHRCNGPADCRPGYGCFADPFGTTENDQPVLVCRPACDNNGQCPDTGSCNPYLGLCDTPSGGSGNFGAACDDRTDCLGWCIPDVGDGYCTSRCRLSSGICPAGGVCANLFGGGHGDEGLCLQACQPLGFDCRTGHTCQERYGTNVCWPVF